jgi:hypothetical protein
MILITGIAVVAILGCIAIPFMMACEHPEDRCVTCGAKLREDEEARCLPCAKDHE